MDIQIRRATLADANVIAGFNQLLAQETEHLQLDAARVQALVHDHVRGAGAEALERLPGHTDNHAEGIS